MPGKVQSPSTVFGKIFIQEAFLSFVWCNCFSLTVLYSESIVKQSKNSLAGNQEERINFPLARDAYKLWEYAMSLLKEYSDWNTELPNPEVYDQELAELIPKVNGLFITAIKFILAHEFAHIELKHSERSHELKNPDKLNVKFEKEADARAIELVLAGMNEDNRVTTQMGILIGLCCLLFFDSSTKEKRYPDTDKRVDEILRLVNPDEQDGMWGIATLAYKLWDNLYSIKLDWKAGLDSPKHLYEYIKKRLNKFEDRLVPSPTDSDTRSTMQLRCLTPCADFQNQFLIVTFIKFL